MSVIAFSPNVGPIKFDCVLTENHVSEIEITGNPIETGAEVSDHAYVKPKQVKLEIVDAKAALTYNALVRFQESRIPFYMVTGLTLYKNMLVKSIDASRDKNNSSILRATVILHEIMIASTGFAPSSTNDSSPETATSGRGAEQPTVENASNPETADRAGGTVVRGDTPSQTVPESQNQPLLKGLFG